MRDTGRPVPVDLGTGRTPRASRLETLLTVRTKENNTMKVLVTGDRNWCNKDRIRQVLSTIPNIEFIVEGGARGADTLAREVATDLGIEVREYKADWNKHGRAAGPIRNRLMLYETKPNLVVAFHNNILESKGTRDMVRITRSKDITAHIYTETGVYEGDV